jgi:putative endonuclease
VKTTSQRGGEAEEMVAERLRGEGFAIVARNVRVGRLEIDLIARRGSLIVFCEVRSRATDAFVDPILTIGRAKIWRVRRAAEAWLTFRHIRYEEVRFDAASVVLQPDPAIAYYEGAF